jgi:hypothetical protein
MVKRLVAGATLLAALLATSGCGSSHPSSAAGPSSPAPLSSTAGPTPSATATPTPTKTATPTPAPTLLQTTSDPHATPWTDKNADFGWLRKAVAVSGGVEITFDRATWLLPSEIKAWNTANPGHKVVDADDYAIGNVNTKVRTFLVEKGAVIFGSVALTGDEPPARITLTQLVTAMASNPGGETVWLYHEYGGLTGNVVQLEEQFRP